MKRITILLFVLLTLMLPVNGIAKTTTSGNTSTKTTVEKTVKKRSDGGTIETTVTTTVTKKIVGKKKTVKTVVKTVVVERAPDGFIESEETTVETTVETTTTSSGKKTSSMYKDVTKKKVGTQAYNAIKHLKAHKAFTGVIKGKKFYPKKKITKKQYLRILKNLYGKYAPTESNPKGYVTEKYATSRLVKVAKNMGVTITWKGRSHRITRADACVYIKIFADFDPAFKLH